MTEIYLDNSATTKPLSVVKTQILKTITENYGNPSSLHKKGLEAEKIIKKARGSIASRLGAKKKEIYFTSGGTEGNNLALKGISSKFSNRGNHIITTIIEHKAVLNVCKHLENMGFKITYLPVNKEGKISLKQLKKALKPETILVSIMHVNNEIGTVQPVKKAAQIIKNHNKHTFFHVDGVQAFGKILSTPAEWNIDLYTISGHKIHGPKGIGALSIKVGTDLQPLLHGGGQENNIRSGTENMPGIAGFESAVNKLPDLSVTNPRNKKLAELKNYFLKKIKESMPQIKINTPADGAPHIANISLANIKGEVMVHALSGDGIYISTGSACHTNSRDKSNVLRAINLPQSLLEGTLRISFAYNNTKKEIDYTIKRIKKHREQLF